MKAEEKADAIQQMGFVMGQLRNQIRTLLSEKCDLQRQVFNLEGEIGRLYGELLGRNMSIDEWSALRALMDSQVTPGSWPPRRIVTVPPDVAIAALYPELEFWVDLFLANEPEHPNYINHSGMKFNWIAGAGDCPRESRGNVQYVGTIDLATWTREELEWLVNSLYSIGNRTGANWLLRKISSRHLIPLGHRPCPPTVSASSVRDPTP